MSVERIRSWVDLGFKGCGVKSLLMCWVWGLGVFKNCGFQGFRVEVWGVYLSYCQFQPYQGIIKEAGVGLPLGCRV